MDPDDALTASAQLHNPCRDTTEGWLWYCDEHDTHGNADSRDEARFVASAHRARRDCRDAPLLSHIVGRETRRGHLGVAELAGKLGVSRQRVHQLRAAYSDFPTPVAELANGPIWHDADVAAWVAKHPQRPTGVRLNRMRAR
jgi:predicted DNA-binding transcriptional regulator AlpA